ncbi:DsbA family oxidoreductase [Leucobacter sp. UCMA 4100]|uniref:DsbA family oxidoreductase n=1 Tax=Leucobacter sp. UCMA 4100 TaxID=2810534 RepID=UPI0022EA555D|nr:DsbA family oxidoreductase [Leucobacter sp. UCMA 4100]MDA3147586.1 DsbA family oxidoreductase [Leucobacter sp. UCMA 4100]
MTTLTIDIWSDVMCPFCYLGDSVLAKALAEFEHRDQVTVTYHSYQLMPELSVEPVNLQELLAGRYGPEQLAAQHEHLAARGKEHGLEYNFDTSLAVNTRKAHELSHFATSKGKGHEAMLRLFKAHFTEGLNVADVDTLARLAGEVGLDEAEARASLERAEFADAVDKDIVAAQQMGINGVPFFVFAGKYALSGAQPKEMFAQALNTAWGETE